MRCLFNSLLVLFLSLFLVSCDEYGDMYPLAVGLIVAVIIVGGALAIFFAVGVKQSNRAIEAMMREAEEKKARESALQQEYKEQLKKVIQEFGIPDITIDIESYNVDKEIRAYSDISKIVILGQTYDFSSILSCNITDDCHTERGDTIITSQGTSEIDSGDFWGRAVVGGLVADDAGAILGGASASRNLTTTSIVEQEDDYICHNYTVWVYVKDIANPLIKISVGDDFEKANEIAALMNAIIAQQ